MIFNLTIVVCEKAVVDNAYVISELSKSINTFFNTKDYGNGVMEFSIGFIMARTRPGYEEWYKPAKEKFIDFKRVTSKLTGEVSEIHKKFSCEIRLSDEQVERFINSTENDCIKIIGYEILKYLESMSGLPKKAKDFNLKAFVDDVRFFILNIL